MKITDEKETQKNNNRKTEKTKGLRQARVKVWEINDFAVRLT